MKEHAIVIIATMVIATINSIINALFWRWLLWLFDEQVNVGLLTFSVALIFVSSVVGVLAYKESQNH